MDFELHVTQEIPEIEEISDQELKEKVVKTWATALSESEYEDIADIPWFPANPEVGAEKQLPHLRDVVTFSIALADQLGARREIDLNRDLVVAGAILHDVSKPYEFSGDSTAELLDWLPHPHYAVYILERFGYSLHLQHIVLAHSHRSSVAPKTIEAKIVQLADWMASHAIYWENTDKLYHNVP